MKDRFKKILKDNKGQAMVEFSMMLPLFFILIIMMIICYNFINQAINAQHSARTELRSSIDENAEGDFRLVTKSQNISVDIPGKMSEFMMHNSIEGTISIHGYEGCYQGNGKSRYITGKLKREIKK